MRPRIQGGPRAGFSMVEVLGVLLILGMVIGVTSISWQSLLPRTRLNTDVRVLSERLQGTRSDAISRNLTFHILYDLENQKYWVETPFKLEGGLAGAEDERVNVMETNLSDGVTFASVTVDGETYSDGIRSVRFDPLGASNDHLIVLYHEAFDRFFTIEVLALTGMIRFHTGEYVREPVSDNDFN